MHNKQSSCFTRFHTCIDEFALPERFTFPFYYQPHPLCVLASEQLQEYLLKQTTWQHNFGLGDDPHKIIGKMFGVLLVKNSQGEIGFLSAFSGKLAEQNHITGFVPPVFDLLANDSFFLAEQPAINQINYEIDRLESSEQLKQLKQHLDRFNLQSQKEITELRTELTANRKQRKQKRIALDNSLFMEQDLSIQKLAAHEPGNPVNKEAINKELAQQSVFDKWRLKDLTSQWQGKCVELQSQIDNFETQISELKQQRKQRSSTLQKQIFTEYRFLNQGGKHKSLLDIFANTSLQTPPAGAGECAAPKLLHYAFLHDYKPLAMAEFWWGASPKSEVKQHKQYYPACTGKCEPILKHMLAGMALDENPLLKNTAQGKELQVIYQDADLIVINKPAEFLSVPGKHVTDSVYQRISQQCANASGPLIVHRLDMSTSGLMVLALSNQANKLLQKQFIHRQVKKEYVALVNGIVEEQEGEINLPLRGDLYDRPKQLVCFEHGKPAKTAWQVIERDYTAQRTKLKLTPHTGRTHQLRIHCAHAAGLNCAIVGDDLYGQVEKRLHLHAQLLGFIHPTSKQYVEFVCPAEY